MPQSEHKTAKEMVSDHEFRVDSNPHSGWAGYETPTSFALAAVDVYFNTHDSKVEGKSIAVAAIHVASIYFNIREQQKDLGEEYSISTSTIGEYYKELAEPLFPEDWFEVEELEA